jgi:phospholipase/lecithinase/hemolysin
MIASLTNQKKAKDQMNPPCRCQDSSAGRRILLRLWHRVDILILLLPIALASSVYGQGFTGMVIFGTSLSDPGNHFIEFGTTSLQPFAPVPDASYAIGGHHFSDGATWAEQVATALGTPKSGHPALRPGGGFSNYALGRVRVRQCMTVPAACPGGQYPFGVVDLGFEVNQFLSDAAGSAPPEHLYVIEVGVNDVSDALTALETDSTGATSAAIIDAAVTTEATYIEWLYAAGARTFLITTTPNFALTPYVRALGPAAQFAAGELAAAYDGAVGTVLASFSANLPGIRFIHFDFNSILGQIEAQPASFGIKNATDPCLTFGVIGNAICAMPDTYLFWDGIHPTTAGHHLVAAAAIQVLSR